MNGLPEAPHVATIIVAPLLSTVLVKTYFLPKAAPNGTAAISAFDVVTKGKSVDCRALNVDWARNHRTLVLAISTTCHYCTQSTSTPRGPGTITVMSTSGAISKTTTIAINVK